MSARDRYPIPAGRHRVEQEITHSRFITTIGMAASADEAQAFIRAIGEEFADATHNCWAYVAGPPGDTGRVGMSDAGEPHGTAGRPMLTTLLHSGVGDVVAVVTRYYGGTKLGTGGLVRAYGGGVKLALASLPMTERVERTTLEVVVSYGAVAALQQLFPAHEAETESERFEADVTFRLRLPVTQVDALCAAIMDATRGQAKIDAD